MDGIAYGRMMYVLVWMSMYVCTYACEGVHLPPIFCNVCTNAMYVRDMHAIVLALFVERVMVGANDRAIQRAKQRIACSRAIGAMFCNSGCNSPCKRLYCSRLCNTCHASVIASQ